MEYVLQQQRLILLAKKAIWWVEEKMLLVADIHLGKVGHFRQAGIPIPTKIHQTDLHILSSLIQQYCPHSLTILGDLFHSKLNNEWLLFEEWREHHKNLEINLIKGNHDIIPTKLFENQRIKVFPTIWEKPPFIFSHIPLDMNDLDGSLYNLCGHLHPAVTLNGKGKQSLRLPCFYFGKKQGYLPAFGQFTGMANITARQGDSIFAIVNEKVVQIA
ncbi:MAG: ligase-associated DNA damage response endonuclease PdeM [Thermoflexibacter sp.]